MFRRYPTHAGTNLAGWDGMQDAEAYFEREVKVWQSIIDAIHALAETPHPMGLE